MSLSSEEINSISIAGRVSSSLSLLGSFAIIAAFAFSRYCRSPIHRIIFYNAFYNLFDSVATMISVSGPRAGNTSALCQFQGFALQMFPVADVLWTFVMSLDTYLVVLHRFESGYLHKLEPFYIGVITVLTFIPAIVFLFIRSPEKGPVYGSETVGDTLVASCRGHELISFPDMVFHSAGMGLPRILIGVVLLIYFLIGFEIFKLRHDFKLTGDDHIALTSAHSRPSPARLSWSSTAVQDETLSAKSSLGIPSRTGTEAFAQSPASQPPLRPPGFAVRSSTQRRVSFKQYIMMPSLFFLALLATWVAPTINRVAAFIHPGSESFPLLVAVSTLGSLRGFWNGVIFITMGWKGWRRRRKIRSELSRVRHPC
ncbi:hypothetical protein N7468_009760 [Penicillium chermesinum]|uniref:Uncharacterized protein n=1 Tax=Penicillium chermesinum TaxID=63820 RepID=A0A9W9NIQ1_9EURO|nr:uncharacterized protein N7468_009760 [Penicillium chermesinum]KAJ5220556.1 hypothetical protein N7468_009760 [Penicillium chermesinum]KAJ6157982.1 hypothetical protein N7470_005574 [Penicillium chermesinum]